MAVTIRKKHAEEALELQSMEWTTEPEEEIDLLELFFRLLEKAWIIILVAILAAVAMGLFTHFAIDPTYESSAKLYVLDTGNSAIDLSKLNIGEKLADDYVQVFKNWHVYEKVVEGLRIQGMDIPYSYTQLQNMMKVHVISNTRIIQISITAKDPVEAQRIATAYAYAAKSFIANTMKTSEPTIFEEARVPSVPSGPSLLRNVILAFLLGAVAAAAVVIVLFLVDDRIRTSEQLEKRLGLATLGLMPIQEKKTRKSGKEGRR